MRLPPRLRRALPSDHTARAAAAEWRKHLANGKTPNQPLDLGWPHPTLAREWKRTLHAKGLTGLVRRHPALLDSLMLSLIQAARPSDRPSLDADDEAFSSDAPPHPTPLGADDAAAKDQTLLISPIEECPSAWEAETGAAVEAGEVLDPLSEGIELSAATADTGGFRAIITDEGWAELLEAQQLLTARPDVRSLLKRLGRGGLEGSLGRLSRMRGRRGASHGVLHAMHPPTDVNGLATTADATKALPLQLASLWSPEPAVRLPALSRLVEGSLLGRHVHGWERAPARAVAGRWASRPLRDSGPLLLCLDTSGSMRGAVGVLARAVILEAARQASRAKRPAFVVFFGGEGELALQRLGGGGARGARRGDDLLGLLESLRRGFGAATSIDAPLRCCLEAVGDEAWAEADVMLVSDGDFDPPVAATMDSLAQARAASNLRVVGVCVQRYASSVPANLSSLCDEVLSLHT